MSQALMERFEGMGPSSSDGEVLDALLDAFFVIGVFGPMGSARVAAFLKQARPDGFRERCPKEEVPSFASEKIGETGEAVAAVEGAESSGGSSVA